MMVRAATTVERALGFYGAESDAWRHDHDDAVAAADLREVIAAAMFVYGRIKHIDDEWSAELRGINALPQEGDARAVERLYAKWAEKAGVDLRRAEELAAKGFRVDGLEPFRLAYHEAQALLSIPSDRVRSAMQSVAEGRGRPMGEIRDELQRRLRA
jgi:hypothetical protein